MSTIKLKKAAEGTTEPVKAERVVENKPTVKSRKKLLDPAIIKEDVSKKTVNSRHYVLNNNTKKSYFSANNINYFDKKEKVWKDVDNSLSESGDRYVGKLGNYSAEIYKAETKKGIKIFKDDAMVSWAFMSKGDNAVVLDVKKEEGKFEGTSASSVVYKNISNDVDLEYKLQGNNVKENIIVHKKSNEYKYDFALDTTGYEVRLSENGDKIEFYLNNEKEFYIPAPFMYDAAGVRSGEVYYELEEKEKGKYVFSVIASAEWINEGNRTLPVTIDPQLVFVENNVFTYKYVNKYLSFGGEAWEEDNASYVDCIKFGGDGGFTVYATMAIVDYAQMNIETNRIIKASLLLHPRTYNFGSYDVEIGGNTGSYAGEYIQLDITKIIKERKPFFYIEPACIYENKLFEIDAYGEYAPTLEVEYITDEKSRHETKKIDFVGGVTGELELNSGRLVIDFNEVLPEDSVMGIGISHTYKDGGNEMGEPVAEYYGFNLNEKLEKFGDMDGQYVYTDGHGNKHLFREYFYKLDNYGKKEYLEVSKADISVDTEGTLTHNGEEVFVEYKSATGLKASTKVEGYAGVEFYDDRSDEIKQLEEQIYNYENYFNELVMVNISSLRQISTDVNNYQSIIAYKNNSNYILLTKAEALQYISLHNQNSALAREFNMSTIKANSGDVAESLASYKAELNDIENKLLLIFGYFDSSRIDLYNKIKNGEIINISELNIFIDKNIYKKAGQNNDYGLHGVDIKNLSNRRNVLLSLLDGQDDDLENSQSSVKDQLSLFKDKKEEYFIQYEKCYKEYVNCTEKLNLITRTLPINYLSNGKIVKGYAKDGKLVAVYDKYEHYAIFEYNKLKKDQIDRIYDDQGKEVKFEYNASGNLISITNAKGRKVECSSYNNVVTHLKYDDGREIELYFAIGMINIDDSKSGMGVELSFEGNRLCNMIRYSLATAIEHGVHQEKTWDYANSITTHINYGVVNSDYYLEIVNENVKERYLSNGEETLIGYQKEVDGKVVAAERYEYVPYYIGTEKQSDPRSVVVKADKSCLYVNNLDNFIFVDGDSEKITFNCFNNAEEKETSPILLTDSNATEQNSLTTTVEYIYDSEQRVTEEKTTKSYSYSGDIVITYKKYYYNNKGDLVRVESYTDGEELTKGKYIEETVYDDQGRVVKSFTYNSLDSSSKFYTQSEYNEKGQVVAEYDETGEHKTEFELCENDEVVLTEKLPNGSKLSYGHDIVDGATSISQSTEAGESNSTNKRYTYGQVTELVSGNTKVNYTYDSKRRITKVGMNGNPNYIEYAYAEGIVFEEGLFDEVITKNAKNETVTRYTDKNGKIRQLVKGGVTVKYTYDEKKRLKTITDSSTSETETRTYDDLDRVVGVTRGGHSESYNYGPFGELEGKSINGAVSHEYNFVYSNDSTKKLESISVNNITVKPKKDVLDRNKGKELFVGESMIAEEVISYRKVGDHATNMPSIVWFGDKTDGNYQVKDNIKYAYDRMGNIEKVYENGELAIRYHYDALSRLVREDNKVLDKTYVFVYDNNGNIVNKRVFAFTLKDNTLIEELESIDKAYIYRGDQLLSYNGQTCEYDAVGNPTTYRGKTATWTNGRQLASYDGHTFTYDGQGKRLTKDSVVFAYDSNGSLIKQGDNMEFIYDQTGVVGLKYSGTTYLYRKDAQGNVFALINESGAIVARYLYDAWGNVSVVDNNGTLISDVNHIGNLNPFRYRGYYYDADTKLYYLKTRYYDPEAGRFMTIDGIEYLEPDTINGLNLYAYCGNNPVSNVDPNGNAWWNWLISGLQIVAGIVLVATGVGAGLGASLIIGGTLGMVGNIAGSQIAGGLGSMANGWGAISTGLSLFSYGWVGAIAGGVMVAVGAGTMAFGANEVVVGVTGTNYIQEWTGMSDSLYGGLYFGLNIVSSIGTIAGRLGMRAYSTSTISGHSHLSRQGQLPYAKITRGNTIVHFDGRGNMYWSKHNALHGGKIGNPHWHSEIRGHGAERSWLGMVFELIFNELFRR